MAIGENLTLVQAEAEDPYFAMDEANPQALSGFIDDLALWHVAVGGYSERPVGRCGGSDQSANWSCGCASDVCTEQELIWVG